MNDRLTPTMLAASLLLALLLPGTAAGQDHSDHAGHNAGYVDLTGREIKALPKEEIQGLMAGEGMGFALTAELNGYPGPLHVLELADELELTPEQRERTEAVMAAMRERARSLGEALVEGERALDRAFREGTVTGAGGIPGISGGTGVAAAEEAHEASLLEATAALGALRGELRGVHLQAHLAMMEILTLHQRHTYQELRGYDTGDHGHGGQ